MTPGKMRAGLPNQRRVRRGVHVHGDRYGTALGTCAPTASPIGEGDTCTAEYAGSCPVGGLACVGLTRGTSGFCKPEWMQRSFTSWAGVSIPDNRATGVSETLSAHGLATVDMDVEIQAVIRHAKRGQLRVTLTNPATTEVTIFGGSSDGTDLVIDAPVRGFSGDESVNGTWTLKVVDTKRGTTGTIERWGLRISSRWD